MAACTPSSSPHDKDELRVISFRKANRKEEKLYEQHSKTHPSRRDADNPEWTRKDIAKASLAAEVPPGGFPLETSAGLRIHRSKVVPPWAGTFNYRYSGFIREAHRMRPADDRRPGTIVSSGGSFPSILFTCPV